MMRALWSAASGMAAQKLGLDCIAHNLANVNTTGYKSSRVEFQDLIYTTLVQAGYGLEGRPSGGGRPVPLQVGHGSRLVATTRNFHTGNLEQTQNPLDLAIDGPGFFRVILPDGSEAYTRDGSFKVSGNGSITTSDGYYLALEEGGDDTEGIIPEDAKEITIGRDGTVYVTRASEEEPDEVGRLGLARFVNPYGLEAIGSNLFKATPASGEVQTGVPGEQGFGQVLQGYLEMSNVDTITEMIGLIVAQRAYEVNAKAIRAADEMLAIANDLRR